MILRYFILVAILATPVLADSWIWPSAEKIYSSNMQHYVLITPGDLKNMKSAWADYFIRQNDNSYVQNMGINLINRVAPAKSLLSNTGYLVTFDNWGSAGFKDVVTIYDPKGKLIVTYEIEQLFTKSELKKIPMSVSSRWWRGEELGFSDNAIQSHAYVTDCFGGKFNFDLITGKYEYQSKVNKRK